jgi:hypothetical protein
VRATLLVIAALATGLLLSACGSSGSETSSVGQAEITVPSDVHGVIPELEAVLAQFPYQRWYSDCIVATVKKDLTPAEAEATEASGAANAEKIIGTAGSTCKESSHRPVVDPNASEKQLDLLRAGFFEQIRPQAEKKGFEGARLECVKQTAEELPSGKVLGLANGTHQVREGILLSVLAQCVKPE